MERFISPVGLGKKDGSTVDDAIAFGSTSINDQISKAGPGGVVWFRHDKGLYTAKAEVGLHVGGTPTGRVTLSSLAGGRAAFRGARAAATGTLAPTSRGKPFFQLQTGGDYLTLKGFDVNNIGDGWLKITGRIKGLTVQDIAIANVRQFIKMMGLNSSLDDFLFDRLMCVGHSKAFIELWNATHGKINNVRTDSSQDGDPIPFGLFADGASSDVLVTDFISKNLLNTRYVYITDPVTKKLVKKVPEELDFKAYWNGDGFSLEGSSARFTFDRCGVENADDGGWDAKGIGHKIMNSYAVKAKRSVRVWGELYVENFKSGPMSVRYPELKGRAHFWLKKGAKLTRKNITYIDPPGSTTAWPHEDKSDGASTVIDL